jgi:hypothetical protein
MVKQVSGEVSFEQIMRSEPPEERKPKGKDLPSEGRRELVQLEFI